MRQLFQDGQMDLSINVFDDFPKNGTHIIYRATGNCQMTLIGRFNNILTKPTEEERKERLKETLSKVAQPLILIDISKGLEERFESLIPEEFIKVKSEYKNTNGTNMILYLFLLKAIEKL